MVIFTVADQVVISVIRRYLWLTLYNSYGGQAYPFKWYEDKNIFPLHCIFDIFYIVIQFKHLNLGIKIIVTFCFVSRMIYLRRDFINLETAQTGRLYLSSGRGIFTVPTVGEQKIFNSYSLKIFS